MSRFPNHALPPPLKPIDQYDQSPDFAKKLDHSYHVILEGLPKVAIESRLTPKARSNCDRYLLDQVLASYAFDRHIVHTDGSILFPQASTDENHSCINTRHIYNYQIVSPLLQGCLTLGAKSLVFRRSNPTLYKPKEIDNQESMSTKPPQSGLSPLNLSTKKTREDSSSMPPGYASYPSCCISDSLKEDSSHADASQSQTQEA